VSNHASREESMVLPVKCEAEHRQDRCAHVLEPIDSRADSDLNEGEKRKYKYRCVKCGKYLKNINGILARAK
jgi:hypothetical protein